MEKSSMQWLNAEKVRNDPLTDQRLDKYGKYGKFGRGILNALNGHRPVMTCQRDTYAAFATFTATSSGDFTITINGVDTVTTFDTSATVTATAAVAALNALTANALCYGGRNIEADNRAGTIALTSTAVGTYFDICGQRITAVAKAADNSSQFEVSGSDTADGQKLLAAIKAHPVLQDLVAASESSGTVTIRSRRASTPTRDLQIFGSAEVVTQMALVGVVCVSSVRKGQPGNSITTAVAGTGSAVSAARMTGGTTTYETL